MLFLLCFVIPSYDTNILIEWGEGIHKSKVLWEFKAINSNLTYVTITNYDFQSTGDELTAKIKDSTGGVTFLLAGLKAWLEHKIHLNLTRDKFPKEMMDT